MAHAVCQLHIPAELPSNKKENDMEIIVDKAGNYAYIP